jgi:phage repressor protein C with HTH and peptisase S24 domain
MAERDARAALQRLIEDRGEDYAGLSRLIGRNPAYVQQYIRRGTPRVLAERDRRLLARYFEVPEAVLGGPAPEPSPERVAVPSLDVGASAGAGAVAGSEAAEGEIAFDRKWLRRLGSRDAAALSIIRVEGDSMAPTLADGDEILVDRGDAAQRLRNGIYVLRIDDALVVKRVTLGPASGRASVTSDNPAYPGWPDCALADIDMVGRVVWVGRRLA